MSQTATKAPAGRAGPVTTRMALYRPAATGQYLWCRFELGNSLWQKNIKYRYPTMLSIGKTYIMSNRGKPGNRIFFFDDIKSLLCKSTRHQTRYRLGLFAWEMKVYGGTTHVDGLSDVHFLRLSGQDGHTISENLYWRGIHRADFTALNRLPKSKT